MRIVRRNGGRLRIAAAEIADVTGVLASEHAHVVESRVTRARLDEWRLTGTTLTDVELTDVVAGSVRAVDARWRQTAWSGGRASTFDAVRLTADGVRIEGVRFEYANLAAARLTDVLFVDCLFTTLDLPQAKADRVAFERCRADEVDTGVRVGLGTLAAVSRTGARGAQVGGGRGGVVAQREREQLGAEGLAGGPGRALLLAAAALGARGDVEQLLPAEVLDGTGAEAGVVGVPHEVKGEAIVCFVVLRPGHEPSEPLRKALSERVASQMGKALKPDKVLFSRDLPKTRSAKIMRRVIRATYLGREPGDLSSLENPGAVNAIAEAR